MGKKINKSSQNGYHHNNHFSNPRSKTKSTIVGGKYIYHGEVTVEELAGALNISSADILKYLLLNKGFYNINSTLDDEIIGEICLNYGFDFEKEDIVEADDFEHYKIEDKAEDFIERAPVVTIMGHVDHGKTTLIDTIRNSNIAAKEAGAITQEIGAYQKTINGKKITFIDTPGHEAFSAMRQRGAQVTDIVVLVVAADDGIMPQTVEAINHAKAANVPIIVAINKIDKPGANIDKVMSSLSKYDLLPEEWGGDTIVKPISAKQNIGVDELLENVLLVAEMRELKANPKRPASGTVIEASLDKKVGSKATLLIQNGTLHVGDYLVIGTCYCKVRRMTNEFNKPVNAATPSTPVSVTGIDGIPQAGDQFYCFHSEKEARAIALKRAQKLVNKQAKNEGVSILNLHDKLESGEITILNLIVKADTNGSLEAACSQLKKLQVDTVQLKIIHSAIGDVNEGDVILASASQAIIVAFNVHENSLALAKAKELNVEIRNYDIIYNMTEEITEAMKGHLKPTFIDVTYGHAEVLQLFKASKVGIICGSRVTDGTIKRTSKVKVYRKNNVIFEGNLASLKRGKDDVMSVKEGFECGIVIDGFNHDGDIEIGDIIESWGQEVEKK